MSNEQPILEMTVEGDFVGPPPDAPTPLGNRVLVWVVSLAGIAVACAVAVFALWLLAFLIPVAALTVAIAYAVFRYRVWRSGGTIQGTTIRWVRRR